MVAEPDQSEIAQDMSALLVDAAESELVQLFDLPAHMDLDAVDTIRDWLAPAIDQGDVQLNGAPVERVYSNCLLMLLAAQNEAESHGHSITINSPSFALTDAITCLGLGENFSSLFKD